MITLRRLDETDRRAFAEAGTLAGPAAGLTWHRQYPTANTLIGYRLLVDAGPESPESTPWWMYHVLRNAEVVGNIGFHGPPDDHGSVEIGYDIVDAVRGQGVATRACAELVKLGRAAGARELRAETDPDNLASQRVLIKNGFLADARTDDGPIRYRFRC